MMKWFDITDTEGLRKHIREELRKKGVAYYDGDPDQGGTRIPRNESLAFKQIVEVLEEATGLPYVPTDDAELMKVVRGELYLKQLKEFIERRKWNSGQDTTNEIKKEFQRIWLENEIVSIEHWKSEVPTDRPEIVIELNIYYDFIKSAIKESEHDVIGGCTAQNFKADLSELCTICPLNDHILAKIKEQIVFQAKQQKDILTNAQFAEYCNEGIKQSQQEMMKISLFVQQDKDDSKFRAGRTLAYIWNKERIKTLNSLQNEQSPILSQHSDNSETTPILSLVNHNDTEKQIAIWEYRLRDFIYIATRYNISSVYAEVKPGFAFSVYFQDHLTEARDLYEQFKQALRDDLVKGNVNSEFYRKDIENRFLPMISHYEEWFIKHREDTEIFGEYNPYKSMWNVIESTRDEIFKYFPELKTRSLPTLTLPTRDERDNQFNRMPLKAAKQWFMQLTETNSRNGKPFLTVEQVEQFIDRAFCGKIEIEPLTFNMSDGERTTITKLFYLFFIRCTNDYAIEPTKQCKEKYVRLLTDNFTNYKYQTVFSTFNNSKNAPKEWKTTV